METYSKEYIHNCKQLGILTEEKIRKHPLRSSNLSMVLKAYAMYMYKPYNVNHMKYDILDEYKLYLTDDGLNWLYDVFRSYPLDMLKSVFVFVFTKATEADIKNLETFEGCRNFRGETGVRPKAGTKRSAVVVESTGFFKREHKFDTVREAREFILSASRFKPIEDFKLYAIQILKGKPTREKLPTVITSNKRGINLNGG